jgi:hypothetical protein
MLDLQVGLHVGIPRAYGEHIWDTAGTPLRWESPPACAGAPALHSPYDDLVIEMDA